MKLDRFDYCYNRGLPDAWRVEDFHLQKINLIVAAGVTRSLKSWFSHILSDIFSNDKNLLT